MKETTQIHESPQCNEAMHLQTERGGNPPSHNCGHVKNNKTIICKICGKKVETKSLNRKYCTGCYKLLQKTNIRKWNEKNRTKEYFRKEYKKRRGKILLYNKTHPNHLSNVKVVCKSCGYLESHYGNGLCKRCYNRENNWKNLEKRNLDFNKSYNIDNCVICGQNISMYHPNSKVCSNCNEKHLHELGTVTISQHMRRIYDDNLKKVIPDYIAERKMIDSQMRMCGLK